MLNYKSIDLSEFDDTDLVDVSSNPDGTYTAVMYTRGYNKPLFSCVQSFITHVDSKENAVATCAVKVRRAALFTAEAQQEKLGMFYPGDRVATMNTVERIQGHMFLSGHFIRHALLWNWSERKKARLKE